MSIRNGVLPDPSSTGVLEEVLTRIHGSVDGRQKRVGEINAIRRQTQVRRKRRRRVAVVVVIGASAGSSSLGAINNNLPPAPICVESGADAHDHDQADDEENKENLFQARSSTDPGGRSFECHGRVEDAESTAVVARGGGGRTTALWDKTK